MDLSPDPELQLPEFSPIAFPVCFSRARRVAISAWTQHVPFAMFLVDAVRPRTLVELGTEFGVSYCAFCQAVDELGLDTRCYAVDTWQGDAHTRASGSEALKDLRAHHDPLYGRFSELIQGTFDDALSRFPDGSIDLLHIDGLHTYEAVKHDFESWVRKVSERGVVIMHDVNVHHGDFGVWKLWENLRTQYPSFEFLHGYGLGLLRVGTEPIPALEPFFSASPKEAQAIQMVFETLSLRLLPGTEMIYRSPSLISGLPAHQLQPVGAERNATPAELGEQPALEQTVSVIIPSYNTREYLKLCLDSLAQLDFPAEHLEIIVVDNASTDDSVGMVRREFPRVRLICNDSNMGFAVAVNQAAHEARAPYVAFLNSDMRVEPGWLNALVEAIQCEPDIAAAGSMVMNWDGSLVEFFGRTDDLFALLPNPYGPREVEAQTGKRYSMVTSGGAMLIRRDLFLSFGGFDTGYFMYHEDVDLGWRLWLRGYKCIVTPGSVVYHRGRASSGKLPAAFVHAALQRNMLITIFRHLERENLWALMPLVLRIVLEQAAAAAPAREAVPVVIQDIVSSLDSLIDQRMHIQAGRKRSDTEIFSTVGHPLRGLSTLMQYANVQTEITDQFPLEEFDPCDAQPMRNAIFTWLNAAHFVAQTALERRLSSEIAERDQAAQGLTAQLAGVDAQLAAANAELIAINGSRAWRTGLRLREFRHRLLPPGSFLERGARFAFNALRRILPAPRGQ